MMFQADIIVPFKTKNDNAVQMLVQNLKVKLKNDYRINDYDNSPSPFKKDGSENFEEEVLKTEKV